EHGTIGRHVSTTGPVSKRITIWAGEGSRRLKPAATGVAGRSRCRRNEDYPGKLRFGYHLPTDDLIGGCTMDVRVIDLDGVVLAQERFIDEMKIRTIAAQDWGPLLRIACRFGRYRQFEEFLAGQLGSHQDTQPTLTFYGSG